MELYLPSNDTERDHFKKDVENISMNGDEHSKLFFARVEGKCNLLSSLGVHKPGREVIRRLARGLASGYYDVEQPPSLLRPSITRSGME